MFDHPVDKADQQPARDQLGLARDDTGEQRVKGQVGREQLRIMAGDRRDRRGGGIASVSRGGATRLEGADADVAGSNARRHLRRASHVVTG